MISKDNLKKILWPVFISSLADDEFLTKTELRFPQLNFVPRNRDIRKSKHQWKHRAKELLLPNVDDVLDFMYENIEGREAAVESFWNAYKDRTDPEYSKRIMQDKGPKLWKSLHVFALYWSGRKKSLTKFLARFSGKIPCGTCRKKWLAIISDNLPDFKNRDELFRWSVRVHNLVNRELGKPEMTEEEARELYSKERQLPSYGGESPREWGPMLWKILHERPFSVDDLSKEPEWLSGDFAEMIPDKEIREHWTRFLKILDPDLSSKETYLNWTIRVHNLVNAALNKKIYSENLAREKYRK